MLPLQVDRAGIYGLAADTDSSPGIDDPRRVKQQLGDDLAKPAAQDAFLGSMSDVVGDDELLRRCLLPMDVTNEVRGCPSPRGAAAAASG